MLEKLYGNGRTARGARDASITLKRRQRENEWMEKLQTVFSYGLDGSLGDGFLKEDNHVLVRSKFHAVPRKSTIISRIHTSKLNTSLSSGAFLNKFNFYLRNKLFFSRIHFLDRKKRNLKQTAILLKKRLIDAYNSLYTQWHYLMSSDFVDSKILKPPPTVTT